MMKWITKFWQQWDITPCPYLRYNKMGVDVLVPSELCLKNTYQFLYPFQGQNLISETSITRNIFWSHWKKTKWSQSVIHCHNHNVFIHEMLRTIICICAWTTCLDENIKNKYLYISDAVGSSRILKAKQKLDLTFNLDKQNVIDFRKFSKMTMCRASEANS